MEAKGIPMILPSLLSASFSFLGPTEFLRLAARLAAIRFGRDRRYLEIASPTIVGVFASAQNFCPVTPRRHVSTAKILEKRQTSPS